MVVAWAPAATSDGAAAMGESGLDQVLRATPAHSAAGLAASVSPPVRRRQPGIMTFVLVVTAPI